MSAAGSSLLRRLPILLLAVMVAVGIALELAVYRTLLWPPKLPLLLCLGLPWLVGRRALGGPSSTSSSS